MLEVKRPEIIIFTPHILVAEKLIDIFTSATPPYSTVHLPVWGRSSIDYTNDSLRLIIVDTAQLFFTPSLYTSFRRHMPGVPVVGLHTFAAGAHQNIQFDEHLYTTMPGEEILRTVRDLLRVEEEHQSRPQLSKREIQVLKLLAQGMTAREIADELYISAHTVTSHRKNLTAKLGIKSVSGMAIYAVSLGLIGASEFHLRDDGS